MAIRVALVGTGNCGRHALRQLITDDRFELTAVWVSAPAKVGKDAGELAGLGVVTGIAATDDLDAIVAAAPDCVVYCAMGDVRLPEAMADVRTFLVAGIDVVGSAPGVLRSPRSSSSGSKRLRALVIRASSSPGSIPASPPTCSPWRWPGRVSASSGYAPWRSPTTPPMTAPRSCST
jgi:hypothetical protein